MFARTLELTVKVDKKAELITRTQNQIMPILDKQKGFVNIFLFENDVDLTKMLVTTLWQTKLDQERYDREAFPKIKRIIEPFLTEPAVAKVYRVEETIYRKLIETAAA
jgi:heme-degrading monooxygenase HmoA